MTIGPEPMIRMRRRSVRLGSYSSTRPYTIEVSGAASSRRYNTSSRRPLPTHATSPLPQSCSPSTLIRRSTRSRIAWASSEASLCVVNDVHSGFWPPPSVLRYEIRYLGMSRSASLLAHQVGEAVEQVVGVVRPGRSLGVVLHREHRPLAMPQPFAGAVVEVEMRRLPPVRRHRRRVDGEAVVLRGDLDLAGGDVLHWVVRAVVPERQLVRPAAGREAQDLMAQAYAEDRHAPEKPADRLDQIRHALGVARPVGDEHAVRLRLEDLRGRRRRGHHRHVAADRAELAQDVVLDAAIVGDDLEARGRRRHVTARELPAAL